MRIRHRLSFPDKAGIRERLRHLDIRFHEAAIAFDLYEDDARWRNVVALIGQFGGGGMCFTEFSDAELAAAPHLIVSPDWHCGYPMPDSDFGYLEQTFDLTDYCEQCGVGARQVRPFRMRGEPRWGKRNILQLHWVYDQFFVHPDIGSRVFPEFGIELGPVLQNKSGKTLSTVVQVMVPATLREPLRMGDHGYEVCIRCKRLKYLPFTRGPLPAPTGEVPAPVVHSLEWFGSGASGFHEFIVSNALFRKLRDAGVRGVSFGCVAET